ncbi:hypothetical protein H6G07_07585 [Phormidium tenue FACHB-1052]|uniref:Uncharacterized protein n=1 Tax=Phormidium tenue NIES-30 TaxID=549789 RepID=A0A1U7J7U8_9CYAN|nr:hypothetical protein [Phormidium tenue FACHB-1052]OKH49224.1 hypothetical protein NIES30_08405 [Phormidium tenue NIES-30]
MLYQHWQYWRKQEAPHELIARFRSLFLDVANYSDSSVASALLSLSEQETANREFKYVLNRCCYTLINLWYTQPRDHWAIPELVRLFEDLPPANSTNPKAHKVYSLVKEFPQTEQYASLVRLQQIMAPAREVDVSAAAVVEEQPLAHRIRHYPFLYDNSLLTKDSGQEQKQNINDLRRRAETDLGIRLARYHAQHQAPGRAGQAVNPTLLDADGLDQALSFYSGKIDGRTHRDQARWFATYSKTVRSFRDFKDEFVDYLISPIAAAEPKYSGNHFTRNLRQYLRETLAEFDNQPLNSFILVETCRRLLNFLVVDSPHRPVFRNFRHLVNDVGHTLTMGLLLRLVLFCSAAKPWLERCFSVLFNLHERRTCKEVPWLVTSLEHANVALITNFNDVGYQF